MLQSQYLTLQMADSIQETVFFIIIIIVITTTIIIINTITFATKDITLRPVLENKLFHIWCKNDGNDDDDDGGGGGAVLIMMTSYECLNISPNIRGDDHVSRQRL